MLGFLALLIFLSSVGSVGFTLENLESQGGSSPIYYAIFDDPDYLIQQISFSEGTPRYIVSTTNSWFRLSPDLSKIVFLQLREGSIAGREYDVVIVDVDDLQQYKLTNHGLNYSPVWSPSGNQVAFIREDENEYKILVTDISLDSDETTLFSSDSYISNIAWSVSSNYIAFIHCSKRNECDLSLLNTESNEVENVTADFGYSVLDIAWLPDSGGLALIASEDNDISNANVYIIGIEELELTQLTFDGAEYRYMEWSSNGELVVFASNQDGDWDIYLLALESLQQFNLTNNGNMQDGFWGLSVSLNTDQLVYTSGPIDGDFEIFLTDLDIFDAIQITDDEFHSVYPTWH